MTQIKYIIKITLLAFSTLLISCEDDLLFTTVEAPAPQVTDEDWVVSAGGVTTGFAEAGRTFSLPNPLEANYRDIDISVLINSNDTRLVDSIFIELQHIPKFAANSAQGWAGFEGIKLADSERSSAYTLNYTLNLDDWSESFWGPENFWIGTGVFGITREDNTMRLKVIFDDGSEVRLAQVMFSYPLSDAGIE